MPTGFDNFADNLRQAYHNPTMERRMVAPCPWDNLKGEEQDRWRAVAKSATFSVQMSVGLSLIEGAKATIKGRSRLEMVSTQLPSEPETGCDCGRAVEGVPCAPQCRTRKVEVSDRNIQERSERCPLCAEKVPHEVCAS